MKGGECLLQNTCPCQHDGPELADIHTIYICYTHIVSGLSLLVTSDHLKRQEAGVPVGDMSTLELFAERVLPHCHDVSVTHSKLSMLLSGGARCAHTEY